MYYVMKYIKFCFMYYVYIIVIINSIIICILTVKNPLASATVSKISDALMIKYHNTIYCI